MLTYHLVQQEGFSTNTSCRGLAASLSKSVLGKFIVIKVFMSVNTPSYIGNAVTLCQKMTALTLNDPNCDNQSGTGTIYGI